MTMTVGQETSRRRPGARRVAGWLATGVTAVLIAILTSVLLVRALLGWQPLTVLSGSMEPTIPTGSIILVDPVDGPNDIAEIRVGDVITFLPHPDDPVTVTHRVVAMTATTKGSAFRTQGDALAQPDPEPVTETQLRGVVRYHLPYVGYLGQIIPREAAIPALVGGAAIYAAWQLAAGARDRQRSRQTSTHFRKEHTS